MSVTVFIYFVMFLRSFVVLIFAEVYSESALQPFLDPYVGVFGRLDVSKHRLPILMYLAVVCNMIGTLGFLRGKSAADSHSIIRRLFVAQESILC